MPIGSIELETRLVRTPAGGSPLRADAMAVLAERFIAASPSDHDRLNTADRYLTAVHAPAEAEVLPRSDSETPGSDSLAAQDAVGIRRERQECAM